MSNVINGDLLISCQTTCSELQVGPGDCGDCGTLTDVGDQTHVNYRYPCYLRVQ